MKRRLQKYSLEIDYIPESKTNSNRPIPQQPSSIIEIEKRTNGSYSIKKQKNNNISCHPKNFHEDSDDFDCDNMRVGASSKVNFSKLNIDEQKKRYVNQAEKINRLKRKLEKFASIKGKRKNLSLLKAVEKIRGSRYDLEDQRFIMENTLKAINTGKLKTDSLGYNQISTIIRNSLGHSHESNLRELNVCGKPIAISDIEYNTYERCLCNESTIGIMMGMDKIEKPSLGNQLRSLHEKYMSVITKTFSS